MMPFAPRGLMERRLSKPARECQVEPSIPASATIAGVDAALGMGTIVFGTWIMGLLILAIELPSAVGESMQFTLSGGAHQGAPPAHRGEGTG